MKLVSLFISIILCISQLHAEEKSLKIRPLGLALISAGGVVFYQARYQHRRFLQSEKEFESGERNYSAPMRHLALALGLASLGITSSLWGAAISFEVSRDTKRIEIGWRFD